MVLSLDLYDAADSAIVEAVTCVVQDDGAFTVPASVWTGWEPGRSLVVVLGRVQESVATLPYNNSTSGMVGIYQELGVAITE
jgi:hypothetical protein